MKIPTLKLLPCVALSAAALAVQHARADMITYDLDAADISPLGDSAPYVQVQVNLTSATTATITFTSLVSGSDVNLLGGPSTTGVNVSGTFTASAVATANNSYGYFAPPPGPFNSPSTGQDDGYGSFNLTYGSTGGYNATATSVSFTIDATGATAWANAASVLTPNNKGQIAAANIYVANVNNFGAGAISTGYAGDAAQTNDQVPDGGYTAIMLGAALLGLAKGRTLFARA